jgi:uncharacterized protein
MATKRHAMLFLLAVCGMLGSAPTGLVVKLYQVRIDRYVPAKMRDGTVLHADVYRPIAPGKFPVILERTPYNKLADQDWALRAAAHGYVATTQDVRGRFASEGEWYPFKYESQDGYDTVE